MSDRHSHAPLLFGGDSALIRISTTDLRRTGLTVVVGTPSTVRLISPQAFITEAVQV